MLNRCVYFEESTAGPVRRVEVPVPSVPLIFTYGTPLEVGPVDGPGRRFTSFVAGVHDRPTATTHPGQQRGVQIDLAPVDAYSLLGVPMHELHNHVVSLADLLGRPAVELEERLADVSDQAGAVAVVHDALPRLLAAGPLPSQPIEWALGQMRCTGGRVEIAALAADIGWSHRHFIERFRRHVGVTPSLFGRLVQFERAAGLVRHGSAPLADVAVRCGYYDQAHMNRAFRDFARCTPTEFAAAGL